MHLSSHAHLHLGYHRNGNYQIIMLHKNLSLNKIPYLNKNNVVKISIIT